jgi:hypothetical protein
MYYLFPAYPVILAAGGVFLERKLSAARPGLRRLSLATLVFFGVLTLPYTVPVLPLETFLRLDERLSFQRHIRFEKGRDRSAPIIYGDMLGWPLIAAEVQSAYQSLPDQTRPVILAGNYGIASALEKFGAASGLPAPICPHNDFYLWGPGERPWDVVLAVDVSEAKLQEVFADVQLLREVHLPHARESMIELHICRSPRLPVPQAWTQLKRYR